MQNLLHFQQRGQGQDLILIHGLFGSLDNLNMVAKPLSENYRVTNVDVRNHGKSFHHSDMTYDVMANDIANLMDHLNIEKANVLGHSMGGKIAMQLALTAPNLVNKLVVADIAPVDYPAHHNEIIAGLRSIDIGDFATRKAADTQLSAYVEDAGVRQFLLRNLVTNNGKVGFKCNISNIANAYNNIMQGQNADSSFSNEVLFIKGGASNYITAEYRPIINQLFPQATAKIIQGAGHWLHAEKTNAFNKLVADFLQ